MKKLLIVLAVLALVPAASARADVIHLGDWTPAGATANIHIGTTGYNVYVGAVPAQVGWEKFDVYCVSKLDIDPPGTLPGDFYFPEPLYMATDWAEGSHLQGERAAYLYNTFAKTSTVDKRALQIAIWNAVFDTDFTASTGNFYANNYTTKANEYLASLQTAQADPGFFADAGYFKLYTNSTMRTQVQGFIGDPVPEPGSMLLLGSGLFGLVGAARRRMKK